MCRMFSPHVPDGENLTKRTQTLTVWRFKKALLLWNDIKSVLSLWIPLNPWGWKWLRGGGGGQPRSAFWCFHLLPPFTLTPQLFSGGSSAWLGSHQCHQSICAHGLGALQGEAQGSTPHQLSQHAEGSGHTEQHSVVIHLSHSIVLHRKRERGSGMSGSVVAIMGWQTVRLKATARVLPAAALRCGRPHWARGSWPCPAPGAHWAQSCKAGRPFWTWGRWAGASGQTHAGRCNVGQSSSGQHGHSLAQPTKKDGNIYLNFWTVLLLLLLVIFA